MLIAATSDIHAPHFLKLFSDSLENIDREPDLFILAGDIVERNQHFYLKKVYWMIKSKFPNTFIVSVFGNNEFIEFREIYKKEYSFMNWLEEEYLEFGKYCLVGTEGTLNSLTTWMRRNAPWIKSIWEERVKKIRALLEDLSDKRVILITHYAPCSYTVYGDPAPTSLLYSSDFEKILHEFDNIRYAFHGHSHQAKVWSFQVNQAKVFNVSLPLHKKIFTIEL